MDNMIEKIQALEPGKTYLLSVDFTSGDIDLLMTVLDRSKKKYGIDFICIDKNTTKLVSAPEDLETILGKTKGLQRIRIFDKYSKNEFGVPEVVSHWLLEDRDKDTFFIVLGRHGFRGIEIDNYQKAQYRYEVVE